MQEEGEELHSGEVQPRQADLDLGVEPFGQEPEGVSTFQATAVEGIGDAQQVTGRLVGQLQGGVEGTR